MRELVVVKLGGSLLTDKATAAGSGRARSEVISRLAREIATARGEMGCGLVLGHGSGSFGHVEAKRWGLRGHGPPADRTRVAEGVAATQARAAALHRVVVGALLEAGARPFSIAPSSALTLRAGRPSHFALGPVEEALGLGLVPVVYGDVALDLEWGAAIASTETLVLALVRRLRRRGWGFGRLLWLGETAGIYDGAGKTIGVIDGSNERAVRRAVGGSAGTDVTGGMRHRLETARALARLGVESWIVDGTEPGLLARALRGEDVPGTRYLPAPSRGTS